MMRWYKNIGLIFLLLSCVKVSAQQLRGMHDNPVIQEHLEKYPVRKKATADVKLSLPFMDDFSGSGVFPDPGKWADRDVFINNSFSLDPITVGVATLDGIDENGNVYSVTDKPEPADNLTSHAFDLSPYATTTDTVRLSFYYQSGGRGEAPEITDSLILECYTPLSGWETLWFAITEEESSFQQVILPIPDLFYHDDFRFRFRNVVSVSANDLDGGEGAVSNADCWNIDYVLLNTDPPEMHRWVNDAALVDLPRKVLDFYEIVPWKHLNSAVNITLNTIRFDIRNLQPAGSSPLLLTRSFYLKNVNTGMAVHHEKEVLQIEPDTLSLQTIDFDIPLTVPAGDLSSEGLYELVSYIETPADQYKPNDSSRVFLHFRNQYAYDDGTPEYGFGIEGPSTNGALLALRFRLYKTDTLKAVSMLFNKARNLVNANESFRICVWKDFNGQPGELLYLSPEEFYPNLDETRPAVFEDYLIDGGKGIYISDTSVFIGWKQQTESFLNLGYDVNRNTLGRTFVNISGNWFNPGGSLKPGTIMMRAVVGSLGTVTATDPLSEDAYEVKVYPNPVSAMLTIEAGHLTLTEIILIDISGRVIMQHPGVNRVIDVSSLAPGVYQVVMITENNLRITRKIIKSH